jgi:hypothetical protein
MTVVHRCFTTKGGPHASTVLVTSCSCHCLPSSVNPFLQHPYIQAPNQDAMDLFFKACLQRTHMYEYLSSMFHAFVECTLTETHCRARDGQNRDGRDNRDRPDLSNPETLKQCLETRFEQLNVACQLEMWQEAFRSIEDIHGLWAINKKSTKDDLRAQYFSCLTRIFSKSGSHCYHAYSWYQLFLLALKNKALTASDRQHLASAVLLSTLAIDPYDRRGPVRYASVPVSAAPTHARPCSELCSAPAVALLPPLHPLLPAR